jgi:mono/diheme cytochrome c family protein
MAGLGWWAHALAADVSHGEQLARQWCANCHVVPGSQQKSALQGPPPFRDIAREGKTPEQLRLFLTNPHGSMPQLSLSRVEIDDLIAYIQTLR